MTATEFELYYGVLPEPMLLTSATGRIRACNEAAVRLLGRNAAELTGLSLEDVSADPPESVARMLTRFSRSEQFLFAALTLKIGATLTTAVHIEGACLRAQPEIELLLRLQLQEDAVRDHAGETAGLLSSIVSSSEDAIVSKDLNGVITSWNTAAERMFGYTAVEAIGRYIADLIIPPDRLNEEPQILERLRHGERVEHFDTVRMRKDGSRLNVSLTISPVKTPDGRIIGASKVARDITARVRAEKELLEANSALERANADLQQFAYSASHDLQEPLRMVAIYSELLKKQFGGQLGKEGDEYIGFTVKGASRMQDLLRDLRLYTQISTENHQPPTEVDADDVLQKTLRNFELAIRESGAVVTSTALPRVFLFEFQLEQLFQNLIGNALRYHGEKPPQIHVAAKMQDAVWLFSIEDNGIGIEPKFREQVFGIFKRLHTAAEYPGTGMGLAICQRIVERAGGRIWIESERGGGSTFYFTLPCSAPSGRAEPPDIFDRSDRGQPGGRRLGS